MDKHAEKNWYKYYHYSVDCILKKHIGKLSNIKQKEIKIQIKSFEDKMAKAIEIENYEVAGVLKLKIQELQQQLNNN